VAEWIRDRSKRRGRIGRRVELTDRAPCCHAGLSTGTRLAAGACARDRGSANDRDVPRTGYSELKSQITRAADSIASNIVEGCAAASRQEFTRFLDISIKSASEVDYRFQLARDLGVLRHDVWKSLAREVIEIRKMLSGLRRTVLAAAEREKRNKRPPVTDPEEMGTEN
jgi:four helix bundle protein